MLALLGLGVLEKTKAFPVTDVSEELIRSAVRLGETTYPLYKELLLPLAQQGRLDLARAIKRKMAVYLDREPGWKGRIKRFDKRHLNGNLTRFKKSVIHKASKPQPALE
jgi:hypothetical protein